MLCRLEKTPFCRKKTAMTGIVSWEVLFINAYLSATVINSELIALTVGPDARSAVSEAGRLKT